MVKVIETNISYDNFEEIGDHQSRIIEVDNWNTYCILFANYNPDEYQMQFNGTMFGSVLPKNARIISFEYDDFHLKCEFQFPNGIKETKLSYLIK